MAKRRGPLHTCGASILAIGHNALTKAQDVDEPLGSMAKRAVSLFDTFFPFIYTMLYQWLAMLSFMDGHILTVEHAVEFVFPPSKLLFDKMDAIIGDAEVLPEKFDDILRRVGVMMMHKFSVVEWVFGLLISRLHYLVSILNLLGSKDIVVTSEKEIRVIEEKEQEIETPVKRLEFFDEDSPMFKSAVSSPLFPEDQCDAFGEKSKSKSNSMKCTYKEMLQSGDQTREDGYHEDN